MPNQVIPDDIPLKDFQVIYTFKLNLVFKNKLIAVLSSTLVYLINGTTQLQIPIIISATIKECVVSYKL